MKLRALFVAATLAIVLPAATLGAITKQDRANGARACTTLRASLGTNTFALTYKTFGTCVSAWTTKAASDRVAATRACHAKGLTGTKLSACVRAGTRARLNAQVSTTKNAAKACAAELQSLGATAFEQNYGNNTNLRNAFGKCVSLHASGKTTGNPPATTRFTADLSQLNNSGVTGTVHLALTGDQLKVVLDAQNLEANQQHMQHIHGLASGNATCPTASADSNHDGLISFSEGLPFYGAVLVPLEPFPTANASGNVHYEETLTVSASTIGALETRTIVLHGKTVSGAYDATLPVACGQIAKA
jgi:hypothetical protein